MGVDAKVQTFRSRPVKYLTEENQPTEGRFIGQPLARTSGVFVGTDASCQGVV